MTDKEYTPDSVQVRIHPFFPTLVAEINHPDPAELNDRLAVLIHRVRDNEPPERRATTINQGWRSTSDLLEQDVPEIRALRTFFDQSIQSYVRHWAGQQATARVPKKLVHRYKGWAVILSEGGYQQQHIHSRTDLVGVYCVNRPRPRNEDEDVGGALTLIDPRTGRLSTRTAWETDIASLPPVPGRLYLLPSFVAHRVEVLTAPGERITINFDVIVLER